MSVVFNVGSHEDANGVRYETFTVTDAQGNVLYERCYGQTCGGLSVYIEDYYRWVNGIGYVTTSTNSLNQTT